MTRATILFLTLALSAGPLAAQHGRGLTTTPPAEANQFDFLVGQWDLDVRPKASGLAQRLHGAPRYAGTWKAWRAFDGFGIEDELRIVDASGNPLSLTHALRAYDAAAGRWTVAGIDVYRARPRTASGRLEGDAIVLTSEATDAEGAPVLVRTRFFEIAADRFRVRQDRSTDNGRTWEEGVLRIDARRSAAAAPR